MTSVCIFFVPFWLNEMSAGLLGDGHVVVVKGLNVQTQSHSWKLSDFIVSGIKFGVAC